MDKFCILPWMHIEARPTGKAAPCCQYQGTVGDFSNQSLNEIWHSPTMKTLRKEFLEGKMPVGCKQCKDTELSGNRSKRQVDNERFKKHFETITKEPGLPKYFDLKLGTVCNIKCRTCSTHSSFKWLDDEKLIYGNPFNSNLQSYWIDDSSPFWNDIKEALPTVEYFDFTGGEPFLIKKHVDILRECVGNGYAKNINIHYNTNGTIRPTAEMFELWKHFKCVDIMFSLDGTNEQFEYMRNPANWNEVVENFNLIKNTDYLNTSVCHTISSYNVMYIPQFLEWFDQQGLPSHAVYLNLVHSPNELSIQYLSSKIKEQVAAQLHIKNDSRITPIIEYMMLPGNDCTEGFLTHISNVDKIRNESYKTTFPLMEKLINE